MKRLLGVLLLILFFTGNALAANYYVATTGDNGNPGTEADPWQTIQWAIDNTGAGDTIYLRGGTYTGGNLFFDNDGGSVGSYKTFTNYAGENAIINHWIYFYITEYVWWDGNDTGQLKFTQQIAVHARVTDPAGSRNNYIKFTDFVWEGSSHESASGMITIHGDNVLVENGTLTDSADQSTGNHGIYPSSGDGIIIRGNTINQCAHWCIHAFNEVRGFQPAGYDNGLTNTVIEDNRIQNSQVRGAILVGANDSSYNVTNTTIRNNILYNNNNTNTSIVYLRSYTGDVDNVDFYNNTVYDSNGHGIYTIGANTDIDVQNAIFSQIDGYDLYQYEGTITASDNFYDPTPNNSGVTDSSPHSGSATFTDAASGDFTLQPSSDAINVCATVASVTDDIIGTSRPQSAAYDCGAYEYIYTPPQPAGEGNDWSGDSNVKAVWNFENGALTTDSKGTNTLTATGCTADTTDFKQGAASIDIEETGSNYLEIADASLDSGFPFKSGDANKKITTGGWIKLESIHATYAERIVTKSNPTTNNRTFSLHVAPVTGELQAYIGYNSGANQEAMNSGCNLSTGRWYHVVWRFQDSDKSYSFRAWDDTAQAIVCTASGTATNNIYIGNAPLIFGLEQGGGSYLDAWLDEWFAAIDIMTNDEIDLIRQGIYGAEASRKRGTCGSGGLPPGTIFW